MSNPPISSIVELGFGEAEDTIYPDWSVYAAVEGLPYPSTGVCCVLRQGKTAGVAQANHYYSALPGEEPDIAGISDGHGGLIVRPGRPLLREGLVSAWTAPRWNNERAIQRLLQLGFAITSTDGSYVPPTFNRRRPFEWHAYQFLFTEMWPTFKAGSQHNDSPCMTVDATADNHLPADTIIKKLHTFTSSMDYHDDHLINFSDPNHNPPYSSVESSIQAAYDDEDTHNHTILMNFDIESVNSYPTQWGGYRFILDGSEPWDSEWNSEVLFKWLQLMQFVTMKNHLIWNDRFLFGFYGATIPLLTNSMFRMYDHANAWNSTSGEVVPYEIDLSPPPGLLSSGQYLKSDAAYFLASLKSIERMKRFYMFSGYVSQVFTPYLITDPDFQNPANQRTTWMIGDRLEILTSSVKMISELYAYYWPTKPFIAEVRLCANDPGGLCRSVTGPETYDYLNAIYPWVDGIQFWNYPWAKGYTNITPEAIDAIEDFARSHPDNISRRVSQWPAN